MARARTQAGFTLLETLIAIIILAGVAMALAPAVSGAARAGSRIHINAAEAEELRTLRSFFHDVVAQSVWLDGQAFDEAFSGDAHELKITTLDPATMAVTPVTLALTSSDTQTLNAEIGAPGANTSRTYIVTTNLSASKFDYAALPDEPSWTDDWQGSTPPSMIRFSGELNFRGKPHPFSFIAATAARAPLNCQFDPVSRRCR